MHSVLCIICGKDETELVALQRGYRMVQCRHCKLVYMNPRPDREELKLLYRNYHIRNGKNEDDWNTLMEGIFRETASFLVKKFPEGGTLLDVGCGYGHFIEIMKKEGWSVMGIDPSPLTLASAKKRGLNVREGTFEDIETEPDSFDAITMFYVLEHLHEPLSALRKAWRLLRPEGILVVRVPHTTPVVRILSLLSIPNNLYDLPFHLYDFSPRTLKEIIGMAGFSGIRIMPGIPTSPPGLATKTVSLSAGHLARALYTVTGNNLLLPGVSKTAIAIKKPDRGRK